MDLAFLDPLENWCIKFGWREGLGGGSLDRCWKKRFAEEVGGGRELHRGFCQCFWGFSRRRAFFRKRVSAAV